MAAIKTEVPFFMGRSNVTKIVDGDRVNYLTTSVSFEEETDRVGADGLVTLNKENKHVLFLFKGSKEVSRYYLGQHLQGKSDDQIIEESAHVLFFESWDPTKGTTTFVDENGVTKTVQGHWVPCAGYSTQESLASKVTKFR